MAVSRTAEVPPSDLSNTTAAHKMLTDNIALVTGAAKGMGEVHARVLAERGATVILTDLDAGAGERVAREIREAGHAASFVRHDVASEADWIAVVDSAIAAHGRIDTLVNNAGILIRKPIEELTYDEFRKLHEINVGGTFLGCKHVARAMKTLGGSIINVSSTSGLVANMPGMSGYCSTKGAIRMLTKATAVDLVRYGIRVNSLHPGTIRTPLSEPYLADPEARRMILGSTVMNRPGECTEVSEAVVFLASKASSFMTGSEMVVDGGMTAV